MLEMAENIHYLDYPKMCPLPQTKRRGRKSQNIVLQGPRQEGQSLNIKIFFCCGPGSNPIKEI